MTPAVSDRRIARGRHRRPSGEPPPLPREFNRVAIGWSIAFVFWAVLWLWVMRSDRPARWITERDLELMDPIVDRRQDWLTPTMRRINQVGTFWLTPIVGWITIVGGLAAKRVRHVLLLIASLSIVALVHTMVSLEILRPRPLGIELIGYWSGAAQPSRPVALLMTAMTCAGLTLVSVAHRRTWYWIAGVTVAVFGAAQVYTGVDHPSDVLPSITLGVAAPMVLYRLAAPERVFPVAYRTGKTAHLDVGGARGEALRTALADQLGVVVTDVERIGLSGSAGSTPLHITQADGPDLFAKLYASTHLRSDRSYKLGRTLLYGRLEDEQHFNSVRRLIQHEDYMLHLMRHAGIDSMEPISIVEITPDREYLLVSEYLENAVEIGDAEVTTGVIDSGLRAVARLWESGLAHRDIKPANVMVQGERVRLIDLSFAEVRPSPWRQAVDLANMMLVLALRSSPELVYERALLQFSEDDIAEAFAASRGVTLPSALRADVRRDGRQLLQRFRVLAPDRTPVAIQRWSLRRIGLMLWVVVVALGLIGIFVDSLREIGLR